MGHCAHPLVNSPLPSLHRVTLSSNGHAVVVVGSGMMDGPMPVVTDAGGCGWIQNYPVTSTTSEAGREKGGGGRLIVKYMY